jgi:hypothetical protein
MILAAILAAFALFASPSCPPPVDPAGARCGQNDPTVDLATYERCLAVFGMTIS